METGKLEDTARELVARKKGLLAADESTGTITKRFEKVGAESTEETRRAYRNMLFTAAGIEEHISGVILYDETIRQGTDDGTPFVGHLASRGMIPGIKVDMGKGPLAGFPGEFVTEGLDGLRERLAEYRDLGARFAKWRAVITIGRGLPTWYCMHANAHALARYAALCQEAGLVPVVEPEVLMDGSHGIEICEEVTARALREVFGELAAHRVHPEGILLKPNMVVSGTDCPERAGPEEVARATVRCLERSVPAAVPGVVFLSGGQSPEEAAANLNAINSTGPHPWELSFSFARALQGPAMEAWAGEEDRRGEAQRAFVRRVELVGAARRGRYTVEMERAA